VLPSVLDEVRRVLGADECALFLRSPAGLERAWGVGSGATTVTEVERLLANGTAMDRDLTLARLIAGDRRLGALSVRVPRELSAEEHLLIFTLGNLIAPVLLHAEYSRQLEVEVDLRTRQIEHQSRFTEKIIDSLPVGLYVIDREYRIQQWNRKRETGMQGVSREEAIGRTIFEILHRQPAALLRQEFDTVLSTGQMQEFQTESVATGDTRAYRISKIPMRLDDVNVTHVITIGEDVTEWKEAEQRISQAEKLAAIGQLAAGVMHEINNPLATIAACAESLMLRLEDMTAAGIMVPFEARDYLKIVDSEVHRCKRIIDGLLDFSRPKSMALMHVDLNATIEKTLFLLKHHARFKKLTVTTDLDTSIGTIISGNAEQLVQVFMALLINAMDAMGERGTIGIRTTRVRTPVDAVVAEVIDRGHGMTRNEV
ncbi:MAG: PAS domain-containing protein, partial [Longimicrobiales bacterium]